MDQVRAVFENDRLDPFDLHLDPQITHKIVLYGNEEHRSLA